MVTVIVIRRADVCRDMIILGDYLFALAVIDTIFGPLEKSPCHRRREDPFLSLSSLGGFELFG